MVDRDAATAENFPSPTAHLRGSFSFRERIRTHISYKVAVLCGHPRTRNQLDPFRRLAIIRQRHTRTNTHETVGLAGKNDRNFSRAPYCVVHFN